MNHFDPCENAASRPQAKNNRFFFTNRFNNRPVMTTVCDFFYMKTSHTIRRPKSNFCFSQFCARLREITVTKLVSDVLFFSFRSNVSFRDENTGTIPALKPSHKIDLKWCFWTAVQRTERLKKNTSILTEKVLENTIYADIVDWAKVNDRSVTSLSAEQPLLQCRGKLCFYFNAYCKSTQYF